MPAAIARPAARRKLNCPSNASAYEDAADPASYTTTFGAELASARRAICASSALAKSSMAGVAHLLTTAARPEGKASTSSLSASWSRLIPRRARCVEVRVWNGCESNRQVCIVANANVPNRSVAVLSDSALALSSWRRLPRVAHVAYCATPLPNDQFSRATSTRLTNTSSRLTPGSRARLSAICANSAFF